MKNVMPYNVSHYLSKQIYRLYIMHVQTDICYIDSDRINAKNLAHKQTHLRKKYTHGHTMLRMMTCRHK